MLDVKEKLNDGFVEPPEPEPQEARSTATQTLQGKD
jgi:hypothetical protein